MAFSLQKQHKNDSYIFIYFKKEHKLMVQYTFKLLLLLREGKCSPQFHAHQKVFSEDGLQ